ncbi:MAG TPA: FliH/SctL family protein [Polyangiaceae bacterium]|nr:FliH/SctL family protein [Polyangiaceae bacterium]
MSSESARPRNVQFVDVTAREKKNAEAPAWLVARPDEAVVGADYAVSPLKPPEVPSHARPALAPKLESVRPPPGPRPPSQFPPAHSRPVPASAPASITPHGLSSVPPPPRSPSQLPSGFPSQFPSAPPAPPSMPPIPDLPAPELGLTGGRERRRDTLVEDLVPRAEEEAVQAIKAAIEQFAEERARALEQAEKELVELVKVICRRVVLREVTLSSSVVEALVQEGLSALGRGDKVHVRLGPFFTDALDHISENLRHHGIDCTVSIDPAVGAHGCALETELGRVDESVETRLNVLFQSLDIVP